MFTIKVITHDGEVREFTAKSFYQLAMGQGRLVVRWEKDDGKEETVTYTRIRTIVEKKVEL